MDIIDKSSIIRGNTYKAFDVALNAMRDYYSKETAKDLYDVYKDTSLSFILSHFYVIVKEAYYGTDFIRKIVSTCVMPPYKLIACIGDLGNVISEGKSSLAPDVQLEKYNSLFDLLVKKAEMMKGTCILNTRHVNYNLNDMLDLYFDLLYEAECNNSKENFMELVEALRDIESPFMFFSIAPLLLSKYPEYTASTIYEITKKFYSPYKPDMEPKMLESTLNAITSLNLLSRDEYIEKALNVCNNANLRMLWKEIMATKVEDIDKKRANISINTDSKVVNTDGLRIIDKLLQEASDDIFTKHENDIILYDNLAHKKVILEHVLESSDMFDEMKLTDEQEEVCIQELADTEAEMLALEWEDDGEPNAVIKQHIQTRKEKEKELEAKKSVPEKKENEEKNDEPDDDESKDMTPENTEYRANLYDKVTKTISTVKGCSIHIDRGDLTKFKAGEINEISCGSFKKETYDDVFKALKDALYDDDNVKVKKDDYYTIYIEIVSSSEYFMESYESDLLFPSPYSMIYEAGEDEEKKDDSKDNQEENKTPEDTSNDESNLEKPQKPKEDIYTKVQNKALDKDVKRKQKAAERKEKMTKVKNAFKATTSPQRDALKKEQGFIKDIDKWDDNRRKKFLIKPGFRHRIFKNLKLAIMYGSAAQMKLFYVPVTMVLRHFSKTKDKRIRNELIRELDTEIRICDEKINDANSNGDQQEKYKLMRIKAKLEAEKNRVTVNSKYI